MWVGLSAQLKTIIYKKIVDLYPLFFYAASV